MKTFPLLCFQTCRLLLLVLLALCTVSSDLSAQTSLIPIADGGFESGGNSGWTFVNGTETNQWHKGSAVVGTGTAAAYVSNDSGVSHAYTISPNNASSIVHMYRSISFPAGETNISLEFDMIGVGQTQGANLRDFLTISMTTATPVAGTTVTTGVVGYLNLVTTWGSYVVDFTCAAGYAGTTQNLIFSWENNGNTGVQPPAAIDNVLLTSHDNFGCSAAETLTVGSTCSYNTTRCGNSEVGNCHWAGSECTWFEFVATETEHAVLIDQYSYARYGDVLCAPTSTVYEGSCTGPQIACQSLQTFVNSHYLTGLTIGTTYYIEVCADVTDPYCAAVQDYASYCIYVTDLDDPLTGLTGPFDEICDGCDDVCDDALVYPSSTPPSVATVVADCGTSDYNPPLTGGTTYSYCNAFETPIGSNIDVGFQNIITSNCGSGNVTDFTWELYEMDPCGSTPVQSGDLFDLIFDALDGETRYAYCYSFTVPSFCEHDQHCPFVYGDAIQIFLPIELVTFTATLKNDVVDIAWLTGTEVNNSHFTIERSADGLEFKEIATIGGAGNSSEALHYAFEDRTPLIGNNYYRLTQTDFDGTSETFHPVHVEFKSLPAELEFYSIDKAQFLLTMISLENVENQMVIYDLLGKEVFSQRIILTAGRNQIPIDLSLISKGVYSLQIIDSEHQISLSFLKD